LTQRLVASTVNSVRTFDTVVTAHDIATFERDGAVCLRDVIAPPWLDHLRDGVEETLREPGPHHHVQTSETDAGLFFTEYYLSRRLSIFDRFVHESPLASLSAELLQCNEIRSFQRNFSAFVKEPGTEKISQWHQDQPYYPINGRQIVVFWLPLDPIEKPACLEVVRGSHRWGKWFAPVLFKNGRQLATGDDGFEPMPDASAIRAKNDIASWDMQPGDCIAFHPLALHGAQGSRNRRRALATTWLGDDTVFASRPGELQSHVAGLVFPEGAPLQDSFEFPLVWPA
jgi:ectoine hydroxylase-related dioxygenase (phytanoyl-CoA dioxygenase family)